jgi:glycosyltransferase involved in cell wall biosynthesis
MPEIFQNCHIVALPSMAEGAPTVLLEASASGRPVVASDIPGCRDIVKHGETGFLFELGNARHLADRVKDLLADKGLRETMGRKGRALMEQRFAKGKINQRTLDVYQKALRSLL